MCNALYTKTRTQQAGFSAPRMKSCASVHVISPLHFSTSNFGVLYAIAASCPSANNAEQSDLTSLNSSGSCLFDFLGRGGGNKCCKFLHRHGSNLATGLWSLWSNSSPYVQLHPPTTLIQASRAPARVLLVTVSLVLHESAARAFY